MTGEFIHHGKTIKKDYRLPFRLEPGDKPQLVAGHPWMVFTPDGKRFFERYQTALDEIARLGKNSSDITGPFYAVVSQDGLVRVSVDYQTLEERR